MLTSRPKFSCTQGDCKEVLGGPSYDFFGAFEFEFEKLQCFYWILSAEAGLFTKKGFGPWH